MCVYLDGLPACKIADNYKWQKEQASKQIAQCKRNNKDVRGLSQCLGHNKYPNKY